MSTLTIEFPVPDDSIDQNGTKISVNLGNGVRLISSVPSWVEQIYHAKLQLIMDIDGTPPHDQSSQTSIQ